MSKKALAALLPLLIACAALAAPPQVVQINTPLLDPSICRGADGCYYLTGTIPYDPDESPLDFRNNRGVKLWKSPDLKTWEDLGLVFDLASYQDKSKGHGNIPISFCPARTIDGYLAFGITQPEIHCIKDNYYITYSQNGQTAGLLKSQTGKPEGPYENVSMISSGYSPSIALDADKNLHWLYGEGWIAPMNDALNATAKPPKLLDVQGPRGKLGRDGAFLIHQDGTYHLYATDIEMVDGKPGTHVYEATAKNLQGPYQNRRRVLDHAGQIDFLPGPDKQWLVVYSPADPADPNYAKPLIIPFTQLK